MIPSRFLHFSVSGDTASESPLGNLRHLQSNQGSWWTLGGLGSQFSARTNTSLFGNEKDERERWSRELSTSFAQQQMKIPYLLAPPSILAKIDPNAETVHNFFYLAF